MNGTGQTIIQLQGVGKSFGGREVLPPLDLDIYHGEFITLLGPSGCGKTTLLRLIGGFEQPDAGRVLLAGSDITDLPPNQRPVNTVFQSYALFPHMTVFENVAYGLRAEQRPEDEIRTRVAQVLRDPNYLRRCLIAYLPVSSLELGDHATRLLEHILIRTVRPAQSIRG